jgi:putative ABC transport system permease protein
MQWAAAIRPALRIARRGPLRARGRSMLVAVLVGVPVMLVGTLTILLRTDDVSAAEGLPRAMGQAAALVVPQGRTPVAQRPTETWGASSNSGTTDSADNADNDRPWTADEVASALGGRAYPLRTGSVVARSADRVYQLTAREMPFGDPLITGLVDVLSGRAPHAVGEVGVSRALAQQLPIGATARIGAEHRQVTVVGVLADGSARARTIFGLPGSLSSEDWTTTFLITRDTPVSWADVRGANERGLVVLSRAVVLDPPPDDQVATEAWASGGGADAAVQAVVVITIASIVLEVVLLSGPAFAVGVRRRRRELALIAVTGGTRRDLRRVVLAEGLVLGAGSATLGALAALPLAAGLIAAAEHWSWASFGPYDVPWVQLAAAVVIGALSAVLAAWWPARQATRVDVVAALGGHRDRIRNRRGLPILGVVLATAGAVLALTLGIRPGGEFLVVGGMALLVLGALLLTPIMIGAVGRVTGGLPPALRMAARDAARNRGRTGPAVAAVMAAVAGITALSIGAASDEAQSRRDYQPRLAAGSALINSYATDATTQEAVYTAVRRALPGRTVMQAGQPSFGDPGHPAPSMIVLAPGCRVTADPSLCEVQPVGAVTRTAQSYSTRFDIALVADPETVAAVVGRALTTEQAMVLQRGGVLVPSTAAVRSDGTVQVAIHRSEPNGTTTISTLPAAVLETATTRSGVTSALAPAVITSATAIRLGLRLQLGTVVVVAGGEPLSQAEEVAIEKAALAIDLDALVYVERGYQEQATLVLVMLAAVGTLLVLIGTLTATGLSLVDAGPDFATLAAIGAAPRTRRVMAGAQALVVGLLGTLLGLAVGAVPGLAVTWPLTSADTGTGSPVIAVPWTVLGLLVLVTPAVAALAAALFTRSRLPMGRRLAQ